MDLAESMAHSQCDAWAHWYLKAGLPSGQRIWRHLYEGVGRYPIALQEKWITRAPASVSSEANMWLLTSVPERPGGAVATREEEGLSRETEKR